MQKVAPPKVGEESTARRTQERGGVQRTHAAATTEMQESEEYEIYEGHRLLLSPKNATGYMGVWRRHKPNGKYVAKAGKLYVGYQFDTALEAAV